MATVFKFNNRFSSIKCFIDELVLDDKTKGNIKVIATSVTIIDNALVISAD